jgi:hypothetical protein
MIGVTWDVTERRRTEEAFREAEERYRLAARATNDAIWDWDLEANEIRWNDAVCTLFGYCDGEVEPTARGGRSTFTLTTEIASWMASMPSSRVAAPTGRTSTASWRQMAPTRMSSTGASFSGTRWVDPYA